MNAFLIGGVILEAILVIWMALQNVQGRQKSGAIESQMNELRRDLQTIATSQASSTGQLEAIAKNVAQRLDSVAPALQDAIKNSAQITGQITSDAQTKMAGELKLRDKKLMAIDSKFPLDAYRRIGTEGEEARRAFATAVKGHADAIAKKYIVPDESTLDVALMFVPSETVYYELLQTQDNKGQPLDAYCRDQHVM